MATSDEPRLPPAWQEDGVPPRRSPPSRVSPATTAKDPRTQSRSPKHKTTYIKARSSIDKQAAARRASGKKTNKPPPVKKEPTMSKKELQEWTGWYKSAATLENYLRGQAEDPHGLLEGFYPCLAELMFHLSTPGTDFYDKCYDELYCWEHRTWQDNGNISPGKIEFGRGEFLMLRIKNKEQEWQDWIYLAESSYGGLGLYTARVFPAGGLLGFYTGPAVWRAEAVGTMEPSSDVLRQYNVSDDSPCLCSVRDAEGRLIMYDPQRIEPQNNPFDLYFGMHYAKGIEESGIPRTPNCHIVEDGSVLADFSLDVDQELICGVLE